MNYLSYLKEAILCLKANRLRSFLALLGLMIGTASVVSLITIGFLAKQAAIEQFKNLGTQKLLLNITSDNKEDFVTVNNIIENISLDDNLNNSKVFNTQIIASTHPITSLFKNIYYGETKINAYQLGVHSLLQKTLKLKLQDGRFLTDYDSMRYYIVIGENIKQQIKLENNIDVQINDHLTIDGNDFIVIGILDHWPVDPLFLYDINNSIMMPISSMQYLTNNSGLSELYFDIQPNVHPKEAEIYLKNTFHQIIPQAHLQFSNAEQILNQIEQQAQILTILLGTIGAISLLVGAIGVMNIMLVAIVERKAEIGLRMAIGATPREIKLQFLFETICLASMGGFLGTLIGIAIPFLITLIAGWTFILPLSSLFFGLSVSLGVGLIAGFYPAIKASRMLPVECLYNS